MKKFIKGGVLLLTLPSLLIRHFNNMDDETSESLEESDLINSYGFSEEDLDELKRLVWSLTETPLKLPKVVQIYSVSDERKEIFNSLSTYSELALPDRDIEITFMMGTYHYRVTIGFDIGEEISFYFNVSKKGI